MLFFRETLRNKYFLNEIYSIAFHFTEMLANPLNVSGKRNKKGINTDMLKCCE